MVLRASQVGGLEQSPEASGRGRLLTRSESVPVATPTEDFGACSHFHQIY